MDSPKKQIEQIKKGLTIQFFNDICEDVELSKKRLMRVLRISESILAIRKKEGVFSFSESERLFRIRRIYNKALEIFTDKDSAKTWLKDPCWLLNNVTPIDYLETEIGGKEIENIFQHIENEKRSITKESCG